MVSYWKLDETDTATGFADHHGTNDGTCSGGGCPTPASGLIDGAMDFEGGDGIVVPDDDTLDFNSNDFTAEVWVKTTQNMSGNKVFIGKWRSATAYWWLGGADSDGYVSIDVKDSANVRASITTGTSINDNEWHHVALVVSSSDSRVSIYVDGISVFSDSYSFTGDFASTEDLEIGQFIGSYNYDGLLDEVAVYNRALEPAEIDQHYIDGMAGSGPCDPADPAAPEFTSTPSLQAYNGRFYTYDVDADGYPAPEYRLTESPDGMTIDSASGEINWLAGDIGDYDVTVEAFNSEGTVPQAFTIHVEEAPPCPVDMTAYYPLEENSSPFEDVLGGIAATCTDCPVQSGGTVGFSQSFDGANDEVNVDAASGQYDWAADDSFTIEYWMKKSTPCTGNEVIVGRDDSGSQLHWWTGCGSDNKAVFQLRDVDYGGIQIDGQGDAINDGEWHHLVFVRDESKNENRIYLDGEEINQGTHDYTAGFGGSVPLNIGYLNLSGHYRYDGLLDEVATYDRALEPAEIAQHYINGQAGVGLCEPGGDTYDLTMAVDPAEGGMTTPAAGSHEYADGEEVAITADPATGYEFDHWTGDVTDPNLASTTVTMDEAQSVTAHFTPITGGTYSLTVNVVGNGSVTPDLAGPYDAGTVVQLTADADSGWEFSGWSGDLGGTTSPESITMDGDKTVTATFTEISAGPYSLTVNVVGNGSVTPDLAGPYDAGTVVQLTADADSGWEFSGWSGDLGGTTSPESITMDGDRTVTATFTEISAGPYSLTVNVVGNGSVTPDLAGPYDAGTVVQLTADADTGWEFSGWSGDLGGTTSPESITMDGDKTVTATFTEISAGPYNLAAYWKLDETESSFYDDIIGDNDGECPVSGNCPSPTTDGKLGGGQVFDRSLETGIDVPGQDFDWGKDDSFTIAFWMNKESACSGTDTSANEVIVGRDDENSQLHWWVGVGCVSSGVAGFNLVDTNDGESNTQMYGETDLTDGRWHHVVVQRDGDQQQNRIYVDGKLDSEISIAYSDGFASATEPVTIGMLNLTGGYHYTGTLDEVAIYNSAISESEIRSLFYLGGPRCDTPIRVMPLGDSITYDNESGDTRPEGDRTGYRSHLWWALQAAGYTNVDFVGSREAGYDIEPPFDPDNEGWPGWTDNQIAANIYNNGGANWLEMAANDLDQGPVDVILLHIGTNGLNESPDDVEDILDEIDEYETDTGKDVTVMLAMIINRASYSSTTTAFNVAVKEMAEARIDAGDKIIIVDMENGADIDYDTDMSDSLHPNDDGYAKMADAWLNGDSFGSLGLADILPVCGPPALAAPEFTSTPPLQAYNGRFYTYDVDADGYPAPEYQLTEAPDDMTIDSASGEINWLAGDIGDYDVTVEAFNSEGTVPQAFTIHVEEAPPCPVDMIAYYQLEEDGAPFEDSLGGIAATCTDCPVQSGGTVGFSQSFDGANDEVNVDAASGQYDWAADDSFTIEYWMWKNTPCTGNEVIVGRDDASSSLHWWTGCDDNGTVRFQLRDVNYNGPYIGGTGDPINDGQWHHLVFVRDESNNENRIYIDGEQTHQATHNYTAGFGGSVPLNIGYLNLSGHYRYDGLLDEVAIYDRALEPAEIAQHYISGQAGVGLCEPGGDTYDLTMAVDPAEGGTTTPAAGDHNYIEDTVVNISASPATGYEFDHWTGDVTDPNLASTTVTMDEAQSVTAHFTPITGGTYSLTVNVVGNGSVTPDLAGPYDAGTVVQLTADADSGWEFSGWSGDLGGTTSPESITMDGDKTVTATFTEISAGPYSLTVNVVGNGSVTPDLAGPYDAGTVVQLTADADSGWEFSGWSGDLGGTTSPESITMDGDRTVTATFTEISAGPYSLTVNVVGNGSVTPDLAGPYDAGTVVQLTADADTGWEFSGWSGGLSGATNPQSITMNGDRTVTATFTLSSSDCMLDSRFVWRTLYNGLQYYTDRSYTLTSVPSQYAGMDAIITPNDDRYLTDASDYLTFQMPYAGWLYVAYDSRATNLPDWMDDFEYTGQDFQTSLASQPSLRIYRYYRTLDMGDCVNLGANRASDWAGYQYMSTYFVLMGEVSGGTTYDLTVNVVGNGSVTLDPPGGSYALGTVVELTANADTGWEFSGWSGGLSGATNPQSITMNGDRTVTATFTLSSSDCMLDSRFVWRTLYNGLQYYTDRSYTLTSVPSQYAGMDAIITPNDDRYLTDASDYLTFQMPYAGWLYVAYDSRATNLPDWMDDFEYTGQDFQTSLASQPSLRIYRYYRTLDMGDCVNLGANRASDWAGYQYMSTYFVLMGEVSGGTTYDLTVNVVGNGSVTLDPPGGSYALGTVVELTANADTGWEFSGWSGGLSGATNPQSITMNGDRTVTATFTLSSSDCMLDSRFVWRTLYNGLQYYTDRSYTLTSVPSQYAGMDAIITPNDDRYLTDASDYLTFQMPYAGWLYVAYDSRATNLPDWMDDFEYTGQDFQTSLASQPSLRIYRYYRTLDMGDCVNLGANRASDWAGYQYMSTYIVFYE
jgi:uncharacterized repeat protein (TIGR02543 family)